MLSEGQCYNKCLIPSRSLPYYHADQLWQIWYHIIYGFNSIGCDLQMTWQAPSWYLSLTCERTVPDTGVIKGCLDNQSPAQPQRLLGAPFINMDVTLNPVWISNHIRNKGWDEMIYPFPNFHGLLESVNGWMESNFSTYFLMYAITYTCWD